MGLVIPFEVGQVFTNNQGDKGTIVKFVTGSKFIQRRAIIAFEDGTQVSVSTCKLTSGSWKNPNKPVVCGVGYIGVGDFNTLHKGVSSRAYVKWNSMLRRCYAVGSAEYVGYGDIGVVVCKEWHNFQNFAEWFYNKDTPSAKLQLDKDLKCPEGFTGKLYSPSTCCLVTSKVNNMMANIDTIIVRRGSVECVKSWKISDNHRVYYCSEDKELVDLFLSEFKLKRLLEIRRQLERSDYVEQETIEAVDLKIYNYTKDIVLKDKLLFLDKIKPATLRITPVTQR
jgi:hypothetical protein